MGSITIEGLPVRDAKRDLRFEVTIEDISVSKPGTYEDCAAAITVRRKLNTKVVIGRYSSFVLKNPKRGSYYLRYITPESLRRQIRVADQGGRFEPASYTLKAPSPSIKKGTRYRSPASRLNPANPTPRLTKVSKSLRPQLTRHKDA